MPTSLNFSPNNAFLGDTSGVWTLSGNAKNLTGQTYLNVKYFNEWMFDASTAFTYAGSNAWSSTDGNGWSVPSPDGTLDPSVVLPVPSTWTSLYFPSFTASIPDPNVPYPYVDIGTGTVGPFALVPFTETIDATSQYNFNFTSSFISTTPAVLVPEPSALMLAALGAIGLVLVAGKRRRGTVAG